MKGSGVALSLVVAAVSTVMPTCVSARQKPGNLTMVAELTPNAGSRQQFEQGLKQLAAWRVSIKDAQSRAVFQQRTGQNSGTYLVVARGMHWADLDSPTPSEEQAQAEFSKAMGGTVASQVVRTYEEIPGLSRPGSTTRNHPAKYYEIGTFHVPLVGDECVLTCVAADSFRNRRLSPAFLWGGLLILCSHPLLIRIGNTPTWARMAT